MPSDLSDAVLEQLRNSPCAPAFGDTFDPSTGLGSQQFFADYAPATTAQPYAVVQEIGESYEFHTRGDGIRPFVATGQMQVVILASARAQARTLGIQICNALNDADLEWPNGRTMYLRMQSAVFVPTPETGPSTPSVFNRVVTFQYKYQGIL